jgi:hypothetical protein
MALALKVRMTGGAKFRTVESADVAATVQARNSASMQQDCESASALSIVEGISLRYRTRDKNHHKPLL